MCESYKDLEREIDEQSSNSGQVCYDYFCTNTLGNVLIHLFSLYVLIGRADCSLALR